MKKITVSLILSSVLWVGSVAAQTLADGQKFSRNEEFEKAEQVYSSLIAKKPKVGDNYYWAALNFLAKGDSLSALNMFNQGLAIAPTFPLNLVGKGHMELRKHNVQGAEAFFAGAFFAAALAGSTGLAGFAALAGLVGFAALAGLAGLAAFAGAAAGVVLVITPSFRIELQLEK